MVAWTTSPAPSHSPVSFPSEAIPNLDTSLTQPCSPEHPHQVTQPFQHHLCPWSRKTHGLLIAPKCIFCPPLLCLHHTALLWSLSVSHATLLHTHTVFDTDFGERRKESQWTWADRKELKLLFLDPRTAAESLLCIWAAVQVFSHLHPLLLCVFQVVMWSSAHLGRCYNGQTLIISGDGPTHWGSTHPSTSSPPWPCRQLLCGISPTSLPQPPWEFGKGCITKECSYKLPTPCPARKTWWRRDGNSCCPFPSLFALPHCAADEETPACSSPSWRYYKLSGTAKPSSLHKTSLNVSVGPSSRSMSAGLAGLGGARQESTGSKGRSARGGSVKVWLGMWQELRRKHRVWKNREEKDCFGGE